MSRARNQRQVVDKAVTVFIIILLRVGKECLQGEWLLCGKERVKLQGILLAKALNYFIRATVIVRQMQ